MSDRFFLLLSRHQQLDEALRAELRRPKPDTARLQQLKRMKLRIKDRLSGLMRGRRQARAA